MKKLVLFTVALCFAPLVALAEEPLPASCETVKNDIAAKLDAKGVKNYTLTVVKNEEVKDGKVVGSCGGGTMKIVYERK